jgi:hypothetical protein
MTKLQSFFAHLTAAAAAVAPSLVALEAAPGKIGAFAAMAVTALVALGLYRLPAPSRAAGKGSEAGFARLSLLTMLCGCALAFALACAAFRSASVAEAERDVLAVTDHLVNACSEPLLASSQNKRVRAVCLSVSIAQRAEEVIVESPPASSAPAGGSGAQ